MAKDEFRYVFTNPEDVRLEVKRKDVSGDVFQVMLRFSHNDKSINLKLDTKNYRRPIQPDGEIDWDELQKQFTAVQVNKIVAYKSNLGQGHLWIEISQDGIPTRIDCKDIDGLT